MKKFAGQFAVLLALLTVAKPAASCGQDFFRDMGTSRSSGGIGPVTPSDYSYEDASPSGLTPLVPGARTGEAEATEEDKYNFAIANFRFSVALGVGIEFNDNITLSQTARESDFIFRPVANLDSEWRITDTNTLKFDIGLSYAKYFQHSEFDSHGVLISPNSELELTLGVGQGIKFTLRDRFSYQEDYYDIPDLNGVADYSRYENQAGLEMDWEINQATDFTIGYDHYNLWTTQDSTDPAFALQDRAIDTIFIKPSFKLSPGLKVGVNASYSFIDFKDADRSNGEGIMAGPFVDWQVTEFTDIYLEGGYQSLHYDHGSNFNNAEIAELGLTSSEAASVQGMLEDNSNSNSWYAKFEIDNRPSEFLKQRLSFSKTAEIGFLSDYITLYNVTYDLDWRATEKLEISPNVFYEHYTTSGTDGEKADRVGAALGFRYHFTNSLTLGLDYRYIWKNSNLEGDQYYQNLVFLSLYYKF